MSNPAIWKLFVCCITHTLNLLFCCTSAGGWNNLLNQWNSEVEWAILEPPGTGLTLWIKMSCRWVINKKITSNKNNIKSLRYWVLSNSIVPDHLQCALEEILQSLKSLRGWRPYVYNIFTQLTHKSVTPKLPRCSVGLPSGDWKDTSIWITAFSYWFLIKVFSEPWSTVGVEEDTPIRIEMLHHRMKGIILKNILLIFSVMLSSKGTGEAKPCQQNTPKEATTFLYNLSPVLRFLF